MAQNVKVGDIVESLKTGIQHTVTDVDDSMIITDKGSGIPHGKYEKVANGEREGEKSKGNNNNNDPVQYALFELYSRVAHLEKDVEGQDQDIKSIAEQVAQNRDRIKRGDE